MSATCQLLGLEYGNALQAAIIDPIGIVLNSICVICFAKVVRNNSDRTTAAHSPAINMFKFLLAKAVIELAIQAGSILQVEYLCGAKCHAFSSPLYSHWWLYYFNDTAPILWMLSPMMEVAATLGINFSGLPYVWTELFWTD
jgi:hypothetical protein